MNYHEYVVFLSNAKTQINIGIRNTNHKQNRTDFPKTFHKRICITIINNKLTTVYENNIIHKPRFVHDLKTSRSERLCNSKVLKPTWPFNMDQKIKETKNRVNIMIRNHSQRNRNQWRFLIILQKT